MPCADPISLKLDLDAISTLAVKLGVRHPLRISWAAHGYDGVWDVLGTHTFQNGEHVITLYLHPEQETPRDFQRTLIHECLHAGDLDNFVADGAYAAELWADDPRWEQRARRRTDELMDTVELVS